MPFTDIVHHKVLGLRRRLELTAKPPFEIVDLINPVVTEQERTATPVHEAFYGNKGSVVHKWRHYLPIYDKYFSRYRGRRVRFLEIGVFRGGSLRMWREYFGTDAVLFGVDIDEHCRRYDGEAGQVRIGSQDDPAFLQSIVEEMGGVDIVLDDGSHVARHQKASFDALFPLLNERGLYLCEDTHTAYWRGVYEGGLGRSGTFIEHSKQLIDDVHAEYHGKPQSLADAHKQILGIHFYNSIVVIEKAPQLPATSIKVGTI